MRDANVLKQMQVDRGMHDSHSVFCHLDCVVLGSIEQERERVL